jgi:hypothetical protein
MCDNVYNHSLIVGQAFLHKLNLFDARFDGNPISSLEGGVCGLTDGHGLAVMCESFILFDSVHVQTQPRSKNCTFRHILVPLKHQASCACWLGGGRD